MPEMSVVRFNESDVIVASVGSFTLNKFLDGSKNNAYVDYNGHIYGYTQSGGSGFPDNLYDVFNANNPSVGFSGDSQFHWLNSNGIWSTARFSEIIGYDETTNSGSVDGTYRWVGNQFEKQ